MIEAFAWKNWIKLWIFQPGYPVSRPRFEQDTSHMQVISLPPPKSSLEICWWKSRDNIGQKQELKAGWRAARTVIPTILRASFCGLSIDAVSVAIITSHADTDSVVLQTVWICINFDLHFSWFHVPEFVYNWSRQIVASETDVARSCDIHVSSTKTLKYCQFWPLILCNDKVCKLIARRIDY